MARLTSWKSWREDEDGPNMMLNNIMILRGTETDYGPSCCKHVIERSLGGNLPPKCLCGASLAAEGCTARAVSPPTHSPPPSPLSLPFRSPHCYFHPLCVNDASLGLYPSPPHPLPPPPCRHPSPPPLPPPPGRVAALPHQTSPPPRATSASLALRCSTAPLPRSDPLTRQQTSSRPATPQVCFWLHTSTPKVRYFTSCISYQSHPVILRLPLAHDATGVFRIAPRHF